MNDEIERENKLVMATITKSILIVCASGLLGFWMSTCRLDPDLVDICTESCDGVGSQMESVTSYECRCSSSEPTRSPWVLN